MDFSDKYGLLFGSIVILCSFYGLFLVFYVNDKVRKINEDQKKSFIHGDKKNKENVKQDYDKQRVKLTKQSKRIMLFVLLIDIFINLLLILIKGYFELIGIIGGILFPIFWYFIFVFFLLIAIGLKGQRVLQTGRFFKGLDY
ncbi:MAG: hypothetical protein JXB00_00140 [Bacteroidales bacterium]|nr:hypothetical protein [Bacteroidales bacterium]